MIKECKNEFILEGNSSAYAWFLKVFAWIPLANQQFDLQTQNVYWNHFAMLALKAFYWIGKCSWIKRILYGFLQEEVVKIIVLISSMRLRIRIWRERERETAFNSYEF